MRGWLVAVLVAMSGFVAAPPPVSAQNLAELFRKISPSVVVIKAKGRDVASSGQVRFGEVGSGVLVSADGQVMTAAHVVHAMDEIIVEFFQTDAVINTGNSGGPMFNLAGQVIGIVSHNISKSGGSEGLGFVVTINTAKKLLLEQKSFWSGLEGRLLNDELADVLNLP